MGLLIGDSLIFGNADLCVQSGQALSQHLGLNIEKIE
jgi:hypothetical protein